MADQPTNSVHAYIGERGNENDVDYRLIIKDSDFLSLELQLQLLCTKTQVMPILAQVKADKESLTPGGIVVAARIARIGYTTEPEKEGTKVVFSGHGRCVNVAYLGDSPQLMFFINRESYESVSLRCYTETVAGYRKRIHLGA